MRGWEEGIGGKSREIACRIKDTQGGNTGTKFRVGKTSNKCIWRVKNEKSWVVSKLQIWYKIRITELEVKNQGLNEKLEQNERKIQEQENEIKKEVQKELDNQIETMSKLWSETLKHLMVLN